MSALETAPKRPTPPTPPRITPPPAGAGPPFPLVMLLAMLTSAAIHFLLERGR
jgi:hypothetical protein